MPLHFPDQRPARIAILLPNLRGGGAERVALTLVGGLLERGHEVDLLLAQDGGELRDLVPPGVRVIPLGADRLLKTVSPLVAYLRQEKPHALHTLMWPLTALSVVAHRAARSKARLVLADHGTLSKEFTTRADRLALRVTLRFLYPLADHRIAVSQGAADDLAALSGLPRSAFEVVRNPMSLPASVAATDEVEQLWAGAEERIVTVGSLIPVKNHALLVQAFALLKKVRPNARLVIVGEGSCRPAIEAHVSELGLQGEVLLPGFTLDPWPYLASANLFALSSNSEAFSLALVEALHAGLNLVSTDCPNGPREILDEGRFGALVPVSDEQAMADALNRQLGTPTDPARQRARAAELTGSASLARYDELLVG